MLAEITIHECGCAACKLGEHAQREDHQQFNLLLSRLDEQQRRWVARRCDSVTAESSASWRSPVCIPKRFGGAATNWWTTCRVGQRNKCDCPVVVVPWWKKDPTLIADLRGCVDPETAGNPCSDEKWVRSRFRGVSQALNRRACPTTIARLLLRDQKYGLRSHRKVLHTGRQHAERDRQFHHIAEQREEFRRTQNPRIRVDTKKKELVGQCKTPGQTWRAEGGEVNDHDFPSDAECRRAAPSGVYDPERNEGQVCVTASHDTADLAVDAVSDWWRLNHRKRSD